MPSEVGKQTQEYEIIQSAAALEMDCVAAFSEAAKQTRDDAAGQEFAKLAAQCEEHVRLWQNQLLALNRDAAKPNRLTAWLNKVKVQVIAPLGHRAIAFVVTNNSADCITAYERVTSRDDLRPVTHELASRMLKEASAQREAIRSTRQ